MNVSEMLSRQGRYLLQLGVVLFLFTSFEGFIIPALAAPNLGRSVHTLSGFVGVLFLAMGLMWPMLKLGATASRIAFWFLIYSSLATIAGFVVAAFLGAGGSIIPIAAQGGAWERPPGSDDPGSDVSGRSNRHCCIRAHPLGPARQTQLIAFRAVATRVGG
jgi:hypothetical protein